MNRFQQFFLFIVKRFEKKFIYFIIYTVSNIFVDIFSVYLTIVGLPCFDISYIWTTFTPTAETNITFIICKLYFLVQGDKNFIGFFNMFLTWMSQKEKVSMFDDLGIGIF